MKIQLLLRKTYDWAISVEFYRSNEARVFDNHGVYIKHYDNGQNIISSLKATLFGQSVLNMSANIQREEVGKSGGLWRSAQNLGQYSGNLKFSSNVFDENLGIHLQIFSIGIVIYKKRFNANMILLEAIL